MPNIGVSDLLELNMLRPLWVRAAPARPSSIVHCPCRAACRMQLAPSNVIQHVLQRARSPASRWARENLSTCSAARNFPLGLGPSCRPNVGRPQSRNFIGTGEVARRVEDPSFGDRSHLVLLPARHNIRLAILAAWSRARIEATSRLPEPNCNPMELARDLWRLSRKHPERRDRLR